MAAVAAAAVVPFVPLETLPLQPEMTTAVDFAFGGCPVQPTFFSSGFWPWTSTCGLLGALVALTDSNHNL